ncbi:MAG: GNAT family N-acetyltransferase [Solirubrobacteraceae bacterium]
MSGAQPLVSLRRAERADEPFLRALYASLRRSEFMVLGLQPSALESLLAIQFDAQDAAYRHNHPDADFDLVIVDGNPGGRLYVDRGPAAIHVLDITLAPEWRGRGIGTRLLGALIAEGERARRPVALQVLRSNPALRLYRHLGFAQTAADEVYLTLERPVTSPVS